MILSPEQHAELASLAGDAASTKSLAPPALAGGGDAPAAAAFVCAARAIMNTDAFITRE